MGAAGDLAEHPIVGVISDPNGVNLNAGGVVLRGTHHRFKQGQRGLLATLVLPVRQDNQPVTDRIALAFPLVLQNPVCLRYSIIQGSTPMRRGGQDVVLKLLPHVPL